MKTPKTLGLALAFVLVVAVARPAAAGQREWATAGKILTGVAAVGIMHHAIHGTPARARIQVTASHPPVHRPRQVVVTHRPRQVVVTTRSRYGHGAYHHRAAPSRRPAYTQPVTVYHGPHRRVVQPRIPGHHAAVQVWRGSGCGWVTVGSHPSIW